ncbi:hypothetical protein V6N13_106975 [Hibiscus sabdariffa]|uniref:Uncharacterized protein n=1 Tax=Hibiscus sabdariffa TaxID=183260 RepID=A0ABR2F2B5_9ROSI
MKTKTSALNCRSSNSISHSNASLTSPLVSQAEQNEEPHLHGNGSGNGESEDTGSSQGDDDNNDDADDKYDDFDDDDDDDEEEGDGTSNGRDNVGDNDLAPDDDAYPDFVEEVGESARVKCILGYWLGVFSYSCGGGNGRVLVCCENGCPIAMHELCMNTKPDFDETGKEKPDDESTSKAHGCDDVADGQIMQEEGIGNTSDSENDEDPWRALEDNQGKSGKEEPVLPNAVVPTAALMTQEATSRVPAIESSEFASPDLDAGTLVVHQKHTKHAAERARPQKVDSPKSPSFQPCTSALQGKATTAEVKQANESELQGVMSALCLQAQIVFCA